MSETVSANRSRSTLRTNKLLTVAPLEVLNVRARQAEIILRNQLIAQNAVHSARRKSTVSVRTAEARKLPAHEVDVPEFFFFTQFIHLDVVNITTGDIVAHHFGTFVQFVPYRVRVQLLDVLRTPIPREAFTCIRNGHRTQNTNELRDLGWYEHEERAD